MFRQSDFDTAAPSLFICMSQTLLSTSLLGENTGSASFLRALSHGFTHTTKLQLTATPSWIGWGAKQTIISSLTARDVWKLSAITANRSLCDRVRRHMTLKKLTATAWFRFLRQRSANRCLLLYLYLCTSLCLWCDGWICRTCPHIERYRQDKNINVLKSMFCSVKLCLWLSTSTLFKVGYFTFHILCRTEICSIQLTQQWCAGPLLEKQHATSAASSLLWYKRMLIVCGPELDWPWRYGWDPGIWKQSKDSQRSAVFCNQRNRANLWVCKSAMLCKLS